MNQGPTAEQMSQRAPLAIHQWMTRSEEREGGNFKIQKLTIRIFLNN